MINSQKLSFLVALALAFAANADEPATLSKAEAATLLTTKPPELPHANVQHIDSAQLEKLPVPTQPEALRQRLLDLAEGSIEERKGKLKAKVIDDMVYVRGGSFLRGDFAGQLKLLGTNRMTYNDDDKVLRQIRLSDFWISRYKASYAELDVFADATRRPRTGTENDGKDHHPLMPGGTNWRFAKDYCNWLGELTGQHIDLPTEAQWEYAARSRGQYFTIATDDGNVDFGRNLPYPSEIAKIAPVDTLDRHPVGMFPPNPLGLFDMTDDEEEWTGDWYAADGYKTANAVDPLGPKSGRAKVLRGWGINGGAPRLGATVWRRSEVPDLQRHPKPGDFIQMTEIPTAYGPTVRCVAR